METERSSPEPVTPSEAGMSGCDGCKWWVTGGIGCLLGRAPETCGRQAARRGDDELAARILSLSPEQRDEASVRFRRATKRVREEHASESEDETI